MEAHTKLGSRKMEAIGSRIVKPCTDLERCARRIAISRLDASAAERHDVVSLTRPAAAGPYSVLGSPIGLVVAELDQATPLASRLNRVIRQSVLLPSVAHKAARDAPDVHDVSVSVYVLLRQKQVTLADVVPGREARLRVTRESHRPDSGAGEPAGVVGSRVAGGHHGVTRSALDAARRWAESGAQGRRRIELASAKLPVPSPNTVGGRVILERCSVRGRPQVGRVSRSTAS